jgi:2-polyprenyl-3-methyl-5-hydroxy-6-metoxy-1,4-benzoquinol methylase
MKAFWDERYEQEAYIYGVSPNEFFRDQLTQLESAGSILLPAEGEGRNAVFAASMGWKVDAFDFSEAAKAKAIQLANEKQVKIHYDIKSLENFEPVKATYDAVGLIYNHMPQPLRSAFHQKVINSLKSKGKIILEAFEKRQLGLTSGGPKNAEMLYAMEDLEQDFREMNIEILRYAVTELDEGAFHKGRAKVIRMVATKA